MTMPSEPNAVRVFRSTDSGATWQLATEVPPLQGFAENGTVDTYAMVAAIRGDAVHVAMLGHADFDVQQIVWMSGDGGLTWTQNLNAADPTDEFGDWMVYGPGGLLALPARGIVLPTGGGGPFVSIMG